MPSEQIQFLVDNSLISGDSYQSLAFLEMPSFENDTLN